MHTPLCACDIIISDAFHSPWVTHRGSWRALHPGKTQPRPPHARAASPVLSGGCSNGSRQCPGPPATAPALPACCTNGMGQVDCGASAMPHPLPDRAHHRLSSSSSSRGAGVGAAGGGGGRVQLVGAWWGCIISQHLRTEFRFPVRALEWRWQVESIPPIRL